MAEQVPLDDRDYYAANGLAVLLAARNIPVPADQIQVDHENQRFILTLYAPETSQNGSMFHSRLSYPLKQDLANLRQSLRGIVHQQDTFRFDTNYYVMDLDGRVQRRSPYTTYQNILAEMATITVEGDFHAFVKDLAAFGARTPLGSLDAGTLENTPMRNFVDTLDMDGDGKKNASTTAPASDTQPPPPTDTTGKTGRGASRFKDNGDDKPRTPRRREDDDDDTRGLGGTGFGGPYGTPPGGWRGGGWR